MLANIANLVFRVAPRGISSSELVGVILSHPYPLAHKGETQIFVTKCVEKTKSCFAFYMRPITWLLLSFDLN